MKRLLLFLLLSAAAFGQGAFIPPQIALRTVNGITYPIANATITVCPANSAGIPCAPATVAIYNNIALTQPLSNPFTADANGNYYFAAALGTYTVTVSAPGFVGNSYQVTIGGVSAPTSSGTASGPGQVGRFWYTYGDGSAILSIPGGNNAATGLGSQGGVGATATETQGRTMSASATQSVNFVIGLESGCGASFGAGALSWGTMARFGMRLTTTVSSTARYWVGLSDCRAGDFAGGSATYATDTPNLAYCMFRFSTTTDTTWKAICATSNVNQTVVDTGIAIATASSTLFEIIPNSTGTAASFYLNGSLVATISTNIMATNQLLGQIFSVDNKNTNTAEQINFYWSQELFTR